MREERKPNGFYSNMDDDDLIKHIIENHYGETTTEVPGALMANIKKGG